MTLTNGEEGPENILIVAFDGLDYELAREYSLEHIFLKDHGNIDNETGMSERKTSELFASFITGETHKIHGVTGLETYTNSSVEKLENILSKIPFIRRYSGLRKCAYEQLRFLDCDIRRYTKEDYETNTLFDEIPSSEALFIPAYNPSAAWIKEKVLDGDTVNHMIEQMEKEFLFRKHKLKNTLRNKPPNKLTMVHFHFLDYVQHIFYEVGDLDTTKANYQRIDYPKRYKTGQNRITIGCYSCPIMVFPWKTLTIRMRFTVPISL